MICPDPRIACAKRTEQQIRAIVRDEIAAHEARKGSRLTKPARPWPAEVASEAIRRISGLVDGGAK